MHLNVELVNVKNNNLLPRSGHKLVADEKYLYVIGGYVELGTLVNSHEVKGEIWRFHLIYKVWERCKFDKELFNLGASHSAIRIGDCIFITGGTGLPFGSNILNSLIVLNLKKMTQQKFQFVPKKNLTKNLPIGTYGHTMTYVYMDKTPYIFIIGGTTGETYHQEVYQINLITLESELVSDNQARDAPKPRYKHEAFLYNGDIYILGGATGTEFCFSFNIIHKFNVHNRTWSVCKVLGPNALCLRCPSMTQNGRYIYVTGGYPNYDFISDAVLQLDLVELQWSLLGTWISPSYFHDSVFVPKLGAVFIFGGVNRIMPSNKRNSNLYVFRPETGRAVRSLVDLAWEALIVGHSEVRALVDEHPGHPGYWPLADYLASLGVPSTIAARASPRDCGDFYAA